MENKTVLTGVKPTGTPHLGNMVGAIRPAIQLASKAKKSYLFIADLHALNSVYDRDAVRNSSYEVAATFLALGLDTEKTIFFRQSDIPEVSQLSTLLMNVTPKGLMNRGHAYKASVAENQEKSRDPDAGINMGLYTYPILMAADILLYNADVIPVGQDQKQHVEFARDIAGSFNHIYGREILVMPEAVIGETANSIPGFDGRKMSKSYGNTIQIFEDPKRLKNLIMKIVTDSKTPEDPKDPNSSTIFQLYTHFASTDQIEFMRQSFERGGLGYGEAKKMLLEAINNDLQGPREKYQELMANKKMIDEVLIEGAQKARQSAQRTLDKVSRAMLGHSPLDTSSVQKKTRVYKT